MRDPGNAFKRQPWRSLLQAAALTMTGVAVLEGGLNLVAYYQPLGLDAWLQRLFQPPLDLWIGVGVAAALGASTVWVLERWDRPQINTGSLWALVLCLIGLVLLKQIFWASPLMRLNEPQVIAMIVGIFIQGRPYWQRFRRW